MPPTTWGPASTAVHVCPAGRGGQAGDEGLCTCPASEPANRPSSTVGEGMAALSRDAVPTWRDTLVFVLPCCPLKSCSGAAAWDFELQHSVDPIGHDRRQRHPGGAWAPRTLGRACLASLCTCSSLLSACRPHVPGPHSLPPALVIQPPTQNPWELGLRVTYLHGHCPAWRSSRCVDRSMSEGMSEGMNEGMNE